MIILADNQDVIDSKSTPKFMSSSKGEALTAPF